MRPARAPRPRRPSPRPGRGTRAGPRSSGRGARRTRSSCSAFLAAAEEAAEEPTRHVLTMPRSGLVSAQHPRSRRGRGTRWATRWSCRCDALEVGLRLADLGLQRADGGGHGVEGLHLEACRSRPSSRRCSRRPPAAAGSPIVADAACSWICTELSRSISRGALDHPAGRGVEGRDLVEDQLLVAQRLGHDHRGAQRGDRGRRRAVDALDQLDVVLDDDVDGEVVLDRHGELGQQVLVLLPDVEQDVLAQRLGLVGVGGLEVGDRARRAGRRAARRRRRTG